MGSGLPRSAAGVPGGTLVEVILEVISLWDWISTTSLPLAGATPPARGCQNVYIIADTNRLS
jgi:hypothetical protein